MAAEKRTICRRAVVLTAVAAVAFVAVRSESVAVAQQPVHRDGTAAAPRCSGSIAVRSFPHGVFPSFCRPLSAAHFGLITEEVHVMSTRSRAAVLAVAIAMVVPTGAAAAQDSPRPETVLLSPDSRVRALDRDARRLLEVAVAASPTVARMVAALQGTDLIVGIETCRLQKSILGELRILAAAADARYLRIRIGTPNAQRDLISVLGHELQHALEVAAVPEVRDLATQREFYLGIGWARNGGYFETEAALAVGRHVAAELATSRPSRKVR